MLRKQLDQQIEMNKMLEKVRFSSSNIDSALNKLAQDKERGVDLHYDEVERREKEMQSKLRSIEHETQEIDKRILTVEKDLQQYKVKVELFNQEAERGINQEKEDLRSEELHYQNVVEDTQLKTQEAEF
jgi:uncharacterized protein YoxC